MVVDSSALLAILRKEPEAAAFRAAIAQAATCSCSALTLLEASMVLAGRTGDSSYFVELDELIATLGIRVVPHDESLSQIAREGFLRFGKGRHPAALNFGDCVSYALAKSLDAGLFV